MKRIILIWLWVFAVHLTVYAKLPSGGVNFDFYGDAISLRIDSTFEVNFNQPLNDINVFKFYEALNNSHYEEVTNALVAYKEKYRLDDWLYYQLIRKTAQLVSPKTNNYTRYTLYKWFLLAKSGYDATISVAEDKILLYVQSDENVYEIPCHTKNNKQYVCLNYHDYGEIDFSRIHFTEVYIPIEHATKSFSYKISELPEFKANDYQEKEVNFNVNLSNYHFKIKLNNQVKTIFANYPVVDYALYFNIPLSKTTYESLIPVLKKNITGLNVHNGVDYLMRFTRYAFLFETDTKNFGKEKRLTPEQTLLYEQSDCEDRAALFFYLVKEIYNLPMIVLSYPQHITVAVKFEKPVGKPIIYNGERYSVCEPTPQKDDLYIGELLPSLHKQPFEVVYSYNPGK